ncbi:MAG: helix-turn-helix transcriptional regulator [Solirubrobacteraceae bacterium]
MQAAKPRAIRLTTTSYAVLTLVEHLGQATPYDLKQALEKSVENFWHVPHTTFYAEPDRLASGGYLTLQQESGGRRRKIYSLTEQGSSALRAWAESPDTAPPQLRDEGVLKIFAGANPASVFASRRDWHLAKIEELQGYLDNLTAEDRASDASRATLIAGLTYHRMTLDAIDGFLAAVGRNAR